MQIQPPETEKPPETRGTKILFWTALISSWMTCVFFLTMPFGFLFWLIVLRALAKRKTKLKRYLILSSAWIVIPALSFLYGTATYFAGKATLAVGGPSEEGLNLDRDYRAWGSLIGCTAPGVEIFTDLPNNLAVMLWTKIFGFQRSVYHGFYPDKAEADEILSKKGQTINFTRDDSIVRFSLGERNFIIQKTRKWRNFNIDNSRTAQAAIIDDQLIIFSPLPHICMVETYLADVKTGKIFAKYIKYIQPEKKKGV